MHYQLLLLFSFASATTLPPFDPISEFDWDVEVEGKYEISDDDLERLIENDALLTASEQMYSFLRGNGYSDNTIGTFWASRRMESVPFVGNRTRESSVPA